MKNPNGVGSIVYLGKNRRKPYAIRKTMEWEDGKQVRKYIGYYATKREARKALANEAIQPTSSRFDMTFKEVYEEWKASYLDKKNLSQSSISSYKTAFDHAEPLHAQRFTELRTTQLQAVVDNVKKSTATKSKIKLLFGKMFKYAMQNDLVYKDYSVYVQIEPAQPKKKQIFTKEEIEKLFKNADVGFAKDILILAYTGMRIQELLNLTVDDIDFENNILTCGVKTKAGKNRIVPIHPRIKSFLQERSDAAVDGKLYTDNQNNVRRKLYYPTLDQLGIARHTPHDARHTCATLMNEVGMDPVAIMKILGHSDYSMSAETYMHPDTKFLTDNMNKLE